MKVTKNIEVFGAPESDQTENPILLKGTITFDTFKYDERLKRYQQVMEGVRTGDDSDYTDDFKLAGRYFEVMKERVESIDLVMIDGTKITSVEDLYEYQEGIETGNALALQIISSQRLGKKKLN